MFILSLGDSLNSLLNKALRKYFGVFASNTIELAIIYTVVNIFFILIPAVVFSAIEGWTYLESVYFAVVTLTTIGFGDFVPTRSNPSQYHEKWIPLYTIFTSIWLCLGLTAVSMLISQMQIMVNALIHAKNRETEKV